MTNVQPETSPSEPSPWAEIAAELHRIADDFAKLEILDLPKPRSVRLGIQPGGRPGEADDAVIATVDTLGRAVLGKPGAVDEMSGGTYHYDVEGTRGLVTFAVYREISAARVEQIAAGKVLADKEAELERLRAEVEKLRANADPTGLTYGRGDEAQDPQPTAGRVPPHLEDGRTGEVVGPIAAHYDASAYANEFVCACGDAFADEARLMGHIKSASAE